MILKRITFVLLVLSILGCNFVTQVVFPPTATPTASVTPTIVVSLTPTPEPLRPAYIPPECATVPLATVPPDQAVQATPEVTMEHVSQNEQLSILRELGDVVETIYVYPDYNGKDWNEIQARYQAKIEAGLDTQSFYNEMSAMIAELGDEHSFFLSPKEVAEAEAELRGDVEFVGVG